MRAAALCIMLIAAAVHPVAAGAGMPAELEPLAFLLGQWDGMGSGRPGQASGAFAFSMGLQGRVIVRTSFAEYPASKAAPATRHEDLMIIYPEAGAGIAADYYDSEGHHIRYAVTTPAPGEAVFLSEVPSGAPKFRLTYTIRPDSLLRGEFAMAPPGKPEEFARYLAWTSSRTGDEAPATIK
jgi:hypothetical protein